MEVLEFPELGMEAIYKIEVKDFPAFILVDDKGNDFFRDCVMDRMKEGSLDFGRAGDDCDFGFFNISAILIIIYCISIPPINRKEDNERSGCDFFAAESPSSVLPLPGKVGHDIFVNILKGGYQGILYPVNPSAKAMASVRAYPTITDIPDPLDLAMIILPPKVAVKQSRKPLPKA